jgi:hypothetical protein
MKMIVLVLLLAAAGCSKKGSAEAPPCEASIAKGIDTVASGIKSRATNAQMQENMMAMVGKLKSTITQRCVEDKWPAEAIQCFAGIANMKAMQDCQGKLNEEQRNKLVGDMRDIMLSTRRGRMPDGVPGHPPTLGGSGAGSGEAAPGATAPAPAGTPPAADGSAAAPAAPATPPGATTPPAAGSGSK